MENYSEVSQKNISSFTNNTIFWLIVLIARPSAILVGIDTEIKPKLLKVTHFNHHFCAWEENHSFY